jgi:hypothetical protein
MIRILAALCLLSSASFTYAANETCISLDKLTDQIKEKERTYVVLTDAKAIDGAMGLYNSIDGAQIERADTVLLIDLPDGFMYMAVGLDGKACWGLRIGPDKAPAVRRLIMGAAS